MRFGIAKEIITPYFNTTLIGFGTCFMKYFEDIHDDLYARTLFLEDDKGKRIILIALDLLFQDFSFTEQVQEFISKKFDISGKNVFIVYTHTHYGPSVKGYDLWYYSHEYQNYLFERVTHCICRSFINVYDGSMQHCLIEGDWNISRRKIVDEKCIFAPNPMGDKDNLLHAMKFVDSKGNIKVILLNYSCHPSNLSARLSLSAEYPGRLCNLIESKLYGCTAIFFQGAGGDTKLRVSARGNKFIAASHNDINEVAVSIAERVQNAVINDIFKPVSLDLDARQFVIPIPLEIYPKFHFEEEAKRWEEVNNNLLVHCAKYVADNYDSIQDEIRLNGGVIRLSKDILIFTMGGEPSFDVKYTLLKCFPDKSILFFGYCDSIAYIPSDKIIKEGGYEAEGSVTEYKLKGRIKPGVNELYKKYYSDAVNDMEL